LRAHLLPWLLALHIAGAPAQPIPSLTELEAAGAVIGEIVVDTHNIFDLDDPNESSFPYRAANALHIKTRPYVIRRLLLFRSGERVSVRLIEETERLIRANSSVYDVAITPTAYHDGVVDLAVRTRDTWTLQPGLRVRRAGGKNSGGFALKESNLAGTGTAFGLERSTNVDRTGTVLQLSNDHLFDGWTRVAGERATFDDGTSASLSVTRPFYALDTRRAAGASAARFDRIDSIYSAGNVVGQYRHSQESAEVFAGWSRGLIGGWTHRYSAGLTHQTDSYAFEAGRPAPAELPVDRTLAGPFLRYEALEDDFVLLRNRERIQRPEYFAMGFQSSVQLGRSLAAFGSTDQPWQLGAALSKGFRVPGGRELLTQAAYSAQYGSSATSNVRGLGSSVRYYAPQGPNMLLLVAASADGVTSPNLADQLLLGGDNGLRGYPLRYQRGAHRALLNVEERFYSDWYPLRIFRVGAAVFYDLGRAWGGPLATTDNTGWLSNAGVGLRILSARASFGSVLHIDFAFPLHNTDPAIKPAQFLVTTSKTF
jgi:hemolysin activation/secretion protein